MYEDEFRWTSQQLIYYKDERFDTDGYLRISISTKTKDNKSFSMPTLGFTVGNQFQRSFNFDIISATDLLKSFKYAFNGGDIFKDKSQIVKQRMTTQFIIEFTEAREKEKVVKITIKQGDSDFTKVIVPIDVFQIIANATKYFVEKYHDICMRQYEVALQGETTEILQQLPSLIKQMPSQIIPANYPDSSAPDEEVVKETEVSISDLDKFIGADMKNINVPELKKEAVETVTEVSSPFVEKFIKNDLRNLESILNNTSGYEEIGQKMAGELNMDVTLPGITEEETKSMAYVSKMLINMVELRWAKFETPLPSSTPILKYKAKDATNEQLDLAYDLLLFSGYVRSLRRKLEDKTADANENRGLFHMKFRCFLDPYCFSFLSSSQKNLTSVIINRFKYFDSIGVFKEYKNVLEMHSCSEITENDILSYINELSEKSFGKTSIMELHDNFQRQNNFRIGSNSNFNKEQIINEIAPLEIAEFMGQDPPNIEVSDEVKQFFKSKKQVSKKVEKKNHLSRVIGTYKKDIPENYREDFMKYIETFSDKNFEFNKEFPYQEFGDGIIKALYVWKPEDNERFKNSLKFYQTAIESEVMEKEFILTLDDKKPESDVEINMDDWEL